MEIRISVKDSLCGEEYVLRNGELCLLYAELFMLPYQLLHSKVCIQKPKNKRDLRIFIYVIYVYKKSRLPGFIQKDGFNILIIKLLLQIFWAAATRAIGTRYGEQLT
jgi:hypothetical protein